MLNRYYKRSRISEAKFRSIVKYFCMDFTATHTAQLTGIDVRSINPIYLKIRKRLAQLCEQSSPLAGTVEVDESYFGAHRVRGKRGRGAYGKTIVFGLLKREGKVYTEIVPDCTKATLQRLIRGKVTLESVIHSDGWRGYDGLVDIGYDKHFRVNHSHNEFALGDNHINGIESFWSFAKEPVPTFVYNLMAWLQMSGNPLIKLDHKPVHGFAPVLNGHSPLL